MAVQQSAPPPQSSDYRTDFLRILNNLPIGTDKPRRRGFVVLARGGTSLKPIQLLCFDEKRTSNHCFTARYRLKPRAALGTLIAALLVDLDGIVRGRTDLNGDIIPIPSDDALLSELRDFEWKNWAPRYLKRLPSGLLSKFSIEGSDPFKKQGIFTAIELKATLTSFRNESILATGQRLLLLGEISEETVDIAQWQSARETLFTQLPERVGLVLSGMPKDFALPTDDSHFLEITLPKEEDVQTDDAEGSIAYSFTVSSFHKDQPAHKDELGVEDYANAIARFLLHKETQAPLTIGIHGPWGKGKSSFMRLIERELIKELNRETRITSWIDAGKSLLEAEARIQPGIPDEAKKEECDKAKKIQTDLWTLMSVEARVISVWFNAWQFEDAKQIWAGLASQISGAMERALPWHSRQWLKVRYAWKERRAELVLGMMLPLAVVGLVAGLNILGFFRNVIPPDKIDTPLGNLLKLLLPASSVLFTLWVVSSQLIKVAQPVSERVLNYFRLPTYREQMGFQHRVKDDLEFAYKFFNKRRPKHRVVVYIDDLDRCSENKIMEVLQAINLILADCPFFLFVGMDTEMVYRAIRSYYNEKVPDRFEESYLRKIIQISLYLPESNEEARLGYLGTLFSAAARLGVRNSVKSKDKTVQAPVAAQEGFLPYDLKGVLEFVSVQQKEVEDTTDELQAFRDYHEFLDDNPRETKRLINIHRLTKILLQKRDPSWPDKRRRKLIKWLVFCDTWPDLVDDILDEKEIKHSGNCLADLAARLEKSAKNRKSTDHSPNFDRLSEFAVCKDDQDALTGADIDGSFRRAAYLSQLVRKSHA
jgi:KAP-like P-loop domain-containing protein